MSEGEDILGGVTAVLQRYNPTGRAIEPETDLAADLNVDSVAAMDLIMEIEDRFEIDIGVAAIEDERRQCRIANVKPVDDVALEGLAIGSGDGGGVPADVAGGGHGGGS